MEKEKESLYYQTATYNVNPNYDFMYDEKERDLFTSEQVSFIIEKIEFALTVYQESEYAVDNAKDVLDWVKRDVLHTDK